MHQLYQDAMSMLRVFGIPHIFITFTCNNWPEIFSELRPFEKPKDKLDLCVRVFKLKFDFLMEDLLKKSIREGYST
jgi:hypothetical protein